MHRLYNVIGALALAALLVACGGGGYSGFVIPQETELKPWVAQSEDEILERAGIDNIDDGAGGGDFVEYEDYEDESDEEEADAPAPLPAPATPGETPAKPAKPAKKPVK